MSFANEVKNEVASLALDHYGKTELMAMFKTVGTLNLSSQGLMLEVATENVKVASRIHRLVKQLFKSDIEFLVSRKVRFKKNNLYVVRIKEHVQVIRSELSLGFEVDSKEYLLIKRNLEHTKAYLRGCFLVCGSVNSPISSNYHLEMSFNDENVAKYVAKLMTNFDIDGRIIMRRQYYVVYVKASDKIADFLKVIGSNQGVLYYERERAERDFLNNINRLDNCEIANDMKMLEAGQRQVEAIELIDQELGLEVLDDKTRAIALLRLKYPDRSLIDLCELFLEETRQVISKSGMHHRIQKIMKLATSLKEA